MSAAEVATLSLQEVLGALSARELSAAAVTEALLERIARFDPQVGARDRDPGGDGAARSRGCGCAAVSGQAHRASRVCPF